MFEFLSSPFGLVAVGLGVLAVAVLALCLWITTLDRRMRGMADGLETERRKVAELQMVIGRRANAARSYGNRGRAAAPAPAPAPVAAAAPAAPAGAPMSARGAGAPVPMGHPAARLCPRGGPCRLPRAPLRARCPEDVGRAPPRLAAGGRPAAFRCRRSRRWTPGCRAHRRCSSPSWCPIARCRARLVARRSAPLPLAPLPSWRPARLAEPRRPLRPSALSERRRPAPPLLRAPPQLPVLLRAFPPRPRALPRCSPLTARLPAPAPATRARGLSATRVGGFPLRNVPSSLKRPAPRMLSARAFLRYG